MNVHQMLLVIGLVFLVSGHAVSQEVEVVVPNEYADTPGPSDSGPFFETTLRYQLLIPDSQFDDLPADENLVTQISWRPDERNRIPITWTAPDFQLSLSTTTADTLSTSFAANVAAGEGETVVYSGDLTVSTAATFVGLKDFDYVVNLQTPFLYDRSEGNLLVEDVFPLGFSTSPHVDAVTSEFQVIGNVDGDVTRDEADFGPFDVNTPIRQLTFVSSRLGDMNGDREVNMQDLTPFAMGLTDIPAYDEAYPDLASTRVYRGDVNQDSLFNFGDLAPFSQLLTSGGPTSGSAIPEPSAVLLLLMSVIWLAVLRARN